MKRDEKKTGDVMRRDEKKTGDVMKRDEKKTGDVMKRDEKKTGDVMQRDKKKAGDVMKRDDTNRKVWKKNQNFEMFLDEELLRGSRLTKRSIILSQQLQTKF